jgi:hypothetical protein
MRIAAPPSWGAGQARQLRPASAFVAAPALVNPHVRDAKRRQQLLAYGLLVGLLAVTALMAQVGIGPTRFFFIAGCFAVAAQAYRSGGLALHVEMAIPLFVFAPFLRRLLDVHTGYDPSGTMLVGPLVALAAALPELQGLLKRDRPLTVFMPFLVMICCLTYGWAISAFTNQLVLGTIVAAKYAIPLLYCMCLVLRPDQSENVLQGAARAFLVVGPIVGLYGIFQHLNPPAWDRFWMIQSKIVSIGQPLPGEVRVFSTMNSPVSFAAYATCGLLLFSFTPRSFIPPVLVPFVALLPLSLALLLTGVRTAWISAAISIAFCLLFNRTRSRAGLLIICLGFGIAVALLLTSFGDVISSRLDTFSGNASEDGSGYERLKDYSYVFGEGALYPFGTGLAGEADPRLNALDGQLLSSAVQMGPGVGLIHMLAIVWAGVQALLTLRRDEEIMRLVASSLVVGNIAISLLTAISIGEIGFLYWMLVGVLTVSQRKRGSRR